MALKELDNSNISKHLGKASNYISQYDPTLLVREPRTSNRTHLGIHEESLPFSGFDTWDGYEISALTDKGAPVTAIAKVTYDCNSPYIVESKSMKLYWNSFNMTRLGYTKNAVYENLKYYSERDLSDLLHTKVQVNIVDPNDYTTTTTDPLFGCDKYFNRGTNIDDIASYIDCDTFSETPDLLFEEGFVTFTKPKLVCYNTSILKSNCRVTSQPDWGDVYIIMGGTQHPTKESLFKYLASFRDECHFHEEIVECITKRLIDQFNPELLIVCGKYVRRGGWGITPLRYLYTDCNLDKNLVKLIQDFKNSEYLVKTARQ